MKKLFLLLGLVVISASVWARDLPNVIVNKSNGGHWAWLNLYNDIQYTPSEDGVTPATLNCFGAGWSFCRVPRAATGSLISSSLASANNTAVTEAFVNAINAIIEFSENNGEKGSLSGSKSITLSIPNGTRGYDTYAVKGEWRYNASGEGTIYIYINSLNNLYRTR